MAHHSELIVRKQPQVVWSFQQLSALRPVDITSQVTECGVRYTSHSERNEGLSESYCTEDVHTGKVTSTGRASTQHTALSLVLYLQSG